MTNESPQKKKTRYARGAKKKIGSEIINVIKGVLNIIEI